MVQLNRLKKDIVSEASRLSSFLEEKLGETPETAPCLRALVVNAQKALCISVAWIDPYLESVAALHRSGTKDLERLALDLENWNREHGSKLKELNSKLDSIEAVPNLGSEEREALRSELNALTTMSNQKQFEFTIRQRIAEFLTDAYDAEARPVLESYRKVLQQRLNHFDFADIFKTLVSTGLELSAKAAEIPEPIAGLAAKVYDGLYAILATLEEYKFPSSKTVKGAVRFEVFMRALGKNITAWGEAAEVITNANRDTLGRIGVHA